MTVLVPHGVAKVWSINNTHSRGMPFRCTPDLDRPGQLFELQFALSATLFHGDFVTIDAKTPMKTGDTDVS